VNGGTIAASGTYAGTSGAAGVSLYLDSSLTNQSGGLITGYNGVWAVYASTVTNYGNIAALGSLGVGVGLALDSSATNQSGGTITGYAGVLGLGGATVENDGDIAGLGTGTASSGVYLTGYGILTNQSSGTITGYDGVFGADGATVVNAGQITGSHAGVTIVGGGTVTNQGGGTISGYDAVTFAAGYTNLLVVDPNAVFVGTVDGGNAPGSQYVSTLELASGASTGVIHGLGSAYQGFQQITIDAGASWALTGTNTIAAGVTLSDFGTLTGSGQLDNEGIIVTDPSDFVYDGAVTGAGTIDIGAGSEVTFNGSVAQQQTIAFLDNTGTLALGDTPDFAATIDGLAIGDTIVLTGVTDGTVATIVNGNTLQVTRTPDPPIDLTLDPTQNYTGATFSVVEQGGNAVVTVDTLACFAEGSRIATPNGMVTVEALRAGDRVHTASGGTRTVRWIGFRRIDLTRHPAPELAQPIAIAAGAFAPNIPSRELRLSPDHAVLLDGMLVPVRLLLNHASIRRQTACRAVAYFHVELDTHDILLAEGLPAESYLDTGNRGMFENAGAPLLLHPAFRNDQVRREAESCAPFVSDPQRVEPLWRRLATRSEHLGFDLPGAIETTIEPDLLIMADGRIIHPVSRTSERYTFLLPAGSQSVRLTSRTAAPSDQHPWFEDRRKLGVMVRRITLRAGETIETIPLDHPSLTQGWWDVEHDPHRMWRWTNGAATLPDCGENPTILDIELAGTSRYPVQDVSAVTDRRQRMA
jgi:hypothetical protein